MATVSTDLFLREVMPYCPDVMELVALNAIRNSAIEFCKETTTHRLDMTAVSGVADQAEYTITVPASTQLAEIVQIKYSGLSIIPKSVEELRAFYPYQDWTTLEGQPTFYTQLTPGTITLVPYPTENATDAITGIIALMPTRDATVVYDDLYNTYAEGIAMGARSRLHYTPGTGYFDMNMAEYCKIQFGVAKSIARTRANKGNVRAMTRVLFNKF